MVPAPKKVETIAKIGYGIMAMMIPTIAYNKKSLALLRVVALSPAVKKKKAATRIMTMAIIIINVKNQPAKVQARVIKELIPVIFVVGMSSTAQAPVPEKTAVSVKREVNFLKVFKVINNMLN